MRRTATSELPLQLLLWMFVASLLVQPLVEPDFGWHLRTGLDLLKSGWHLPARDPYSHTVPDWQWVEHAWLTDGFLGLIYQGLGSIGLLGIIVAFAVVTGAAFWFSGATARAGRTSKLLALSFILWVAWPFLGARTQMISLLGLAVVVHLWERYRAGSRAGALWGFPCVFLLWANLHGGFTAGLFALGLLLVGSCVSRLWIERRDWSWCRDEPPLSWPQIRQLALVLCLAALVTLVNPYGWRLHLEIYQSLTDRFMIDTLREWQPVSLDTRAGRWYLAYLALLGSGLGLFYRKREPVRWLLLGVFLFFSLRNLRNIPFFLLLSVPLFAEVLDESISRLSRAAEAMPEVARGGRLAATLAAAVGLAVLGPDHWQSVLRSGLAPAAYFRGTDYPIEAVEWVRMHRGEVGTKLYNDYGNGGFLLWWLPDVKIFIDGRMPAWRVGDRWIFYDYVALTAWDPPELGVLSKYAVDWAIVETGSPLAKALETAGGWEARYRDRKVVLYVQRAYPEPAAQAAEPAS